MMEEDLMRPTSAVKRQGVMWWSKMGAMTAVCAITLAAWLPGTAAGASATVETVTYSPREFKFQVSPQGIFSGDNNITFRMSRTDGAENCRKIGRLVVAHDPYPMVGTMHQGDYIVGKKELNPPLCNFQNVEVSGSPFQVEDINNVCFDTPMRTVGAARVPAGTPRFVAGRSSVLEKELTVAFQLGPNQPFRKGVPHKSVNLQADVQCVERLATGRIGPDWGSVDTRQEGGTKGSGTGTGTGTAAGTAPAPSAGSAYGGRQFTPVDPRTPPRVPTGGTSTQPAVVPRNPRTVPRVPVGSGAPQPGTAPREPGTVPAPTGGDGAPQLSPSCQMSGVWMMDDNAYWEFNEVTRGIYEVTHGLLEGGVPNSPLPFGGSGGSSCIKPAAVLSGYTLRYFNCGDDSASYYEGTVDSTCSQVSGNMYNTSGQAGSITLTRSRNLRVPVPNPNP
jgi:hypothetical protein